MRKAGTIYIDKTKYLYKMLTTDDMYLLSRPRRFGKTLTVSTLESIFKGERELFDGLFIASTDYDWKAYPIIHIDFGDCPENTASGLDGWLSRRIGSIASSHGTTIVPGLKSAEQFSDLVIALSQQGQVVILVDEYDKVLSDNIFNPEVDAMREVLGNFYQVIKTRAASIRFAFITGVTKYAKVSVFSRMNNLTDLSMREDYATMLGYSKEELLGTFDTFIERGVRKTGMEREAYLTKVKDMYDGYRFHPRAETVYNPVSVGQFFESGGADFEGYWADMGSTKLLMDIAKSVDFNVLEDMNLAMESSQMRNFDVLSLVPPRKEEGEETPVDTLSVIDLMSLLYQTGYLTLLASGENTRMLHFDFPNTEVREAFTSSLLSTSLSAKAAPQRNNALDALLLGKTGFAMECIRTMLSSVPYTIQIGEEKHYQSLLFMMFCSWSAKRISAEEATNIGRIDLVLEGDSHLYVIECKYGKDGKKALEQIKERGMRRST